MVMLSIKGNITSEYIINRSRFITKIIKINDILDIDEKIDQVKNEYADATHYCYAYIINNIKRFNDDGEPSGTAGIPILNVLENNNLNYVLCVVIRYFGGIKLGAGGLVRAYTKGVTNALENCEIIRLEEGLELDIYFNYDQTKDVDYFLKNTNITNKVFEGKIKYSIQITKNNQDKYLNYFVNNKIDYKIKNDIYIEKELI